jgi:hypothetical protein
MTDTTAPCQMLGTRPNSCDRIGLATARDGYTFFTIDPAPPADEISDPDSTTCSRPTIRHALKSWPITSSGTSMPCNQDSKRPTDLCLQRTCPQ